MYMENNYNHVEKFPMIIQGSWDKQGYCSEMIKGVHQICFDVTDETSDFSSETGQTNWSEGRVDKNHCMCLGA